MVSGEYGRIIIHLIKAHLLKNRLAVVKLTVISGCRLSIKESVAMVIKSTSTNDLTTGGRGISFSVRNLQKRNKPYIHTKHNILVFIHVHVNLVEGERMVYTYVQLRLPHIHVHVHVPCEGLESLVKLHL